MEYRNNKVKRFSKWGLVLCLLALLPLDAHAVFAKYGIYDGTTSTDGGTTLTGTWNAAYQGMSITLSGSGTKAEPYEITNAWELCYLEDQVNAGNSFKGKYFKLMNDIDLGGKIWYPIGVKSTTPFAGLFDGNDKTISNMSIVVKDADNNNLYSYGLFGYMKGVVRHLNMTDAYVVINRTNDNAAETLMAGLLCGSMTCNIDENIFGAVYECSVQGSIGGAVSNKFDDTYIGGIAGTAYNPVSIYKCQANVRMTPLDIRYVGGIVGWSSSLPELGERTNSFHTPCVSYIFDCVANINILAELCKTSMLYCGGICGSSSGTLVACVANGTIECGQDNMYSFFNTVQPNMIMGGLTGRNGYSIMNCISTVQLKGGTTVGGLIGRNSNYAGLLVGDVLNSVFCGHIDSPNAEHTHGLVGEQPNNSHAPFNCLFVGTMHGGTNKAPLSSGDTNNCYSDRNMYDDGSEWSCYTYTDEFGTATDSWFVNEFNCNVGWKSLSTGSAWTYKVSSKDWVIKEGFYPYFKVDADNITTGTTEFGDNVIAVATNYFGDNLTVARTPSLYEKYAWLGSVPMNVSNHAFRANFVDTPVSLAIKQQPIDNEGHQKTATYSLSGEEMTISGEHNAQTATPKDNVTGSVMLTITSDDKVSRNICLDVYTKHQWDSRVAKEYDSGDGTEGSPYLIHNARQLMKALTTNESGEFYRLTKDIWFNENLLTNTGEPKEGAVVWNHETNRDNNNWKAHLDGDNHLVHGLYSTNAFGLVEKIQNGASIENTGYVDCLVWSPETDPVNTNTGFERPFGFLTPVVGATAAVRNCLFSGVVKERRTNTSVNDFGAFIHTIDNSEQQIGENPIIEDCVLSIVAKSDIANRRPVHAFLAHKSGEYTTNIAARRVLLLNNSNAQSYLTPSGINFKACHYPEGYLPYYEFNLDNAANARQVSVMTNGTFFTGDGFDKWTALPGRFPVLNSFAATDCSKLIALPVYPSSENRLANMNYLLDFTPGTAIWQTTNSSAFEIDKDIRVIEPKTASSSAYLVRILNDVRMIMPITTAAEITQGIQFDDVEAKKFCLAHYDTNRDNKISLSELKNVTLTQFQNDMNENDNDPDDNDGAEITLFPEFRYFAGITDLGTSFQEKDKLQTLEFSSKITELSDNDFKGNTSMTQLTIPTSITTVSGKAFINSGLENYAVETDHTTFAVADGLLFNKDKDQLVSVPSGRKDASITIPDHVTSIASNAVYKMSALENVYIDAKDYDYKTVVALGANAFTAAEGKQITYYVEDATQEYEDSDDDDDPNNAPLRRARRTNSEGKIVTPDGNGKGALVSKYQESDSWKDKNIERYFELEVSEKSKDANGNYWATMYIGFDTQLPEGLTAYIVDKQKTKESEETLVLREISNKVRMLTPVVIRATKAGPYILYPSKESTRYPIYPTWQNLLEGVNRYGKEVYQSDSNDGGCLTLGKNSKHEVGFFIYKGTAAIPAFRAYLTVNKVGSSSTRGLTFSYADDSTTGIKAIENRQLTNDNVVYDLQGRRVSQPTKGIYINKGRLIIKK
jgi:hypothetical protein